MAIYSGDFATTVTTTGAAAMDFRGGAANSPAVMELAIVLAAATASTYFWTRSANSPTQSGTSALLAENPADPASSTTQAVTWTVAPTQSGVVFRRAVLPATIGAGVVYTFPRGFKIAAAAATGMVWNGATNSANTNVRIVVDE